MTQHQLVLFKKFDDDLFCMDRKLEEPKQTTTKTKNHNYFHVAAGTKLMPCTFISPVVYFVLMALFIRFRLVTPNELNNK